MISRCIPWYKKANVNFRLKLIAFGSNLKGNTKKGNHVLSFVPFHLGLTDLNLFFMAVLVLKSLNNFRKILANSFMAFEVMNKLS